MANMMPEAEEEGRRFPISSGRYSVSSNSTPAGSEKDAIHIVKHYVN